MSFPWADWQFYVVSAVMVAGLWLLVRPFLTRTERNTGCPGCETCGDDAGHGNDLVQLGAERSPR